MTSYNNSHFHTKTNTAVINKRGLLTTTLVILRVRRRRCRDTLKKKIETIEFDKGNQFKSYGTWSFLFSSFENHHSFLSCKTG